MAISFSTPTCGTMHIYISPSSHPSCQMYSYTGTFTPRNTRQAAADSLGRQAGGQIMHELSRNIPVVASCAQPVGSPPLGPLLRNTKCIGRPWSRDFRRARTVDGSPNIPSSSQHAARVGRISSCRACAHGQSETAVWLATGTPA